MSTKNKPNFVHYSSWMIFAILSLAVSLSSCKGEPEGNSDAEFYAYVDQGDSLFNLEEYSWSREKFVNALEIKPEHQNTIDKVALIDSILGQGGNYSGSPDPSNSTSSSSSNNSNNRTTTTENDPSPTNSNQSDNVTTTTTTNNNASDKLALGQTYAGGIIFELNADGTKGKIIYAKDSPSVVYKWRDIQYNTQTLGGTGGWRVATINEMEAVYKHVASKGLAKFSSGQEYWAKGEWNALMGNSYFMRSNRLSWENAAKTRWLPARFVKDFVVKDVNEIF